MNLLNLQPQDIKLAFDAAKSKCLDIYPDDYLITVMFPVTKEHDVEISLDTVAYKLDDYSVVYEDTKYKGAKLSSNESESKDLELNLDLSFLLNDIQDYMMSEDFNEGLEVFFEIGEYSESCELNNEQSDLVKTYGLSNSDFC